MQWSLFLFILMGSFLTCQQYEYHFIGEKKTWNEARAYCKEHYTNLVQWTHIMRLCWSTENPRPVWVRLCKQGKTKQHLCQSGVENKVAETYFDTLREQPPNQKCPMLDGECSLKLKKCNEEKSFFCYDDKVILINKNKTWEEALYYCREKYHDLVSITNRHQQRWVQERAKNADSPYVWLGLRYTCTLDFWFWVSDKVVSYKKWDSDRKKDECDMSGAMERGGEHKWIRHLDNQTFNFICSLY